MSFRTTTLLFGVLLTVIWGFGLMLALRRSTADEGLILPKLARAEPVTIDQVEVTKDGKSYVSTKKADEGWRMKSPDQKDESRVEDSRINDLVNDLKSARHSNDDTDVTRNP